MCAVTLVIQHWSSGIAVIQLNEILLACPSYGTTRGVGLSCRELRLSLRDRARPVAGAAHEVESGLLHHGLSGEAVDTFMADCRSWQGRADRERAKRQSRERI
jgi:hypothetical protein